MTGPDPNAPPPRDAHDPWSSGENSGEPTAPITPTGPDGGWPTYQPGPTRPESPSSQSENPYAAPPPPYPQPAYPQQAYPSAYGGSGYPAYQGVPGQPAYGYGGPPTLPAATTAMVLGIVSVAGGLLCALPFLLGPVAAVMGYRARREIAASRGALGGSGSATAGLVLGLIASALVALFVLLIVLFVGLAAA